MQKLGGWVGLLGDSPPTELPLKYEILVPNHQLVNEFGGEDVNDGGEVSGEFTQELSLKLR